jgi:hypothetical protein
VTEKQQLTDLNYLNLFELHLCASTDAVRPNAIFFLLAVADR